MKPNEARGRAKYYKSHHQLLLVGSKGLLIVDDLGRILGLGVEKESVKSIMIWQYMLK
jgi:hypothetical protein